MIATLCMELRDGRLFWDPHHAEQMFERPMPTRADIELALCEAEADVIEADRRDSRGQRYVIWGTVNGRVAHVVCFLCRSSGRVLTAYWPDLTPTKWTNNYKTRVGAAT
jgi:uncharacterized DUF497 family protein